MSAREFLSPDLAAPEARWRSPLERALRGAPAGLADVSRTGKFEVRGEFEPPSRVEVIRVTPRRALVLCSYEEIGRMRGNLPEHALDRTATFAGLRVQGERLMRRLTDLDLDTLPAVGPIAHVRTIVLRDERDSFRLFFPQEYADHVAAVVLDAVEGLGA